MSAEATPRCFKLWLLIRLASAGPGSSVTYLVKKRSDGASGCSDSHWRRKSPRIASEGPYMSAVSKAVKPASAYLVNVRIAFALSECRSSSCQQPMITLGSIKELSVLQGDPARQVPSSESAKTHKSQATRID